MNLHKIRSLPLIMGSEPFVVDLAQIVLSLSHKNHISRYFIDSVVLLISFTVNGPNQRSNMRKETSTKTGRRIQHRIRNLLNESHKKVTNRTYKNHNAIFQSKSEI